MRLHLTWPDWSLPLHGAILPEEYLALVTMHGTLMLFFVLTSAAVGVSNPTRRRSRCRMAFPLLNALSLWLTVAALITCSPHSSFRAALPSPAGTAYPPLSASSLAGPGSRLRHGRLARRHRAFFHCLHPQRGHTLHHHRQAALRRAVHGNACRSQSGDGSPPLCSVRSPSVCYWLRCRRFFQTAILHTAFFLPSQESPTESSCNTAATAARYSGCISSGFFGYPMFTLPSFPALGLDLIVLDNFSRRRRTDYRLTDSLATTPLIGLLWYFSFGDITCSSWPQPLCRHRV